MLLLHEGGLLCYDAAPTPEVLQHQMRYDKMTVNNVLEGMLAFFKILT
jgi:hypothetical protein